MIEAPIEAGSADYDYIVVGSGAGGGPLAANLATSGYRVLLIEAGSDPHSFTYQVPCFNALASEDKAMAWEYFVHHYSKDEDRDEKYVSAKGGVFYPRAGTLGGCTAHNAMITIVPHDSDWNGIAELTGDESWRAEKMHKYFAKLERNAYRPPPEADSGHGFSGWLSVEKADPMMAVGDRSIIDTFMVAMMSVARQTLRGGCTAIIRRLFRLVLTQDDPNDVRINARAEGMSVVPLATDGGKRNGPREHILRARDKAPDKLTIALKTLATRVIFDDGNRAVGVECLEGPHLYKADPNADAAAAGTRRSYRCRREVILAGGAFNTPQLLMLSGIGPKAHLEEHGITCRADRPGVGQNLQDRYEVAVVSEMDSDFKLLKKCTFKPPAEGEPGDPCFQEWQQGKGVYTTNGAVAAAILRSKPERPDPDLFIFGLPGLFKGYFPGYSEQTERAKNFFTWAIIKAHTNNTAGQVRLRSSDPRAMPDVNFHYFEEGNDPKGEDLESVVNGVLFARQMNKNNKRISRERIPGRVFHEPVQIAHWVRDNAWGHHASCSCKMGVPDDPMAVVDSRFRVIG
ncbi:MAG TPA: GMC family oxidoreductase N-terminal domain-containing protein, partial [Thermoanaerobaculia bacterium]|nr:GMC family oxidoreductase N-terminal domain-containing protein [Thermoanaerobaculia bacterium]